MSDNIFDKDPESGMLYDENVKDCREVNGGTPIFLSGATINKLTITINNINYYGTAFDDDDDDGGNDDDDPVNPPTEDHTVDTSVDHFTEFMMNSKAWTAP